MLDRLLGRFRSNDVILSLYAGIVAQARRPEFYRDLAVPDTLDGRFDLIIVHAVVVMRRLRRGGQEGRAQAQALFDAFFADMDRSLREMGVSDLGVPKRIKDMARVFYGRAEAYDPAIETGDATALAAALRRNVYAGAEAGDSPDRLAAYVVAADLAIAARPAGAVLGGGLPWPPPPGS